MKSDEGFSNMLDKTILIDCLNENVIRFPNKNTLNTEIKQNSKRAVFTALFLCLSHKSSMNFSMNVQ